MAEFVAMARYDAFEEFGDGISLAFLLIDV